ATHHTDALELTEEPALAAELVERARAVVRPRPEFPFNPGVIGAERRVPHHDGGKHDKPGDQHLARRAVIGAEPQQNGERHTDVEGIALLEAERAWRQAHAKLKKEKPGDGRRSER